jgi:SAM-dependent methyltransferase
LSIDQTTCRPTTPLLALLLFGLLSTPAAAQDKPAIPYVPTPQFVVERMLDLAKVSPEDVVVDLGSGDGRIPITAAAKFGARGFGVDIDPRLVARATENAAKAGVSDRVTFRQQDLFETPLAEATVLTLYLPVAVNIKLRPRLLQELRPGTRIVAHQFAIGDWEADLRELLNHRYIYLWYVPAPLQGTWQVTDGNRRFNLHLWQNYQRLSGTASMRTRHFSLEDLLLRGDALDFAIEFEQGDRRVFRGRVAGDRIVPRSGPDARDWQAVRVSDKPTPRAEE